MSIVKQHPHVTRRWLLSGFGTSLTLAGGSVLTYANEGGHEPDPSLATTQNIDNSPPKKKQKKLNVVYTQKNLKRVKTKDIKTAIRANKQGHSVVIEGFSKKMSSKVFEMLLLNRKHTLTLIKALSTYTDRSTRKDLIRYSRTGIITDRVEDSKLEDILFPDKQKEQYVDLLIDWERRPKEGTIKPPKKKKVSN